MGLASDLANLREAGGLLGRTNRENGALPLLALGSKLLVLGSLGRDASRQRDVLEDGVVLSDGHVDLGILGLLLERLLLLLALHEAALGRAGVALVHVLDVLRIGVVLSLSCRTVGFSLDVVEDAIKLVSRVLDLLLQNLLNNRAHNLEEERLEHVEEKLVVALLHLDLQVLDIRLNLGDLEEVGLRMLAGLVGSLHLDLEAKAGATHEDVHDALVGDGRETLLALDVVRDVPEVHLHTRDGEHDLVLVLARNGLATPAPVVVRAKFERVGCKVVALNDKVLDNRVHHGVAVLNAWNGDVANILKDGRKDDFGHVLDKVRLEDSLAILVLTEITEQLVDRLGELLVLRVSIKLLADELEFISNAVSMASVTAAEEVVAIVVELVPLSVEAVLKDKALLLKGLANEVVDTCEPVLELRIIVGVLVNLVDGLNQVIE
jgi:hypothetical protein